MRSRSCFVNDQLDVAKQLYERLPEFRSRLANGSVLHDDAHGLLGYLKLDVVELGLGFFQAYPNRIQNPFLST